MKVRMYPHPSELSTDSSGIAQVVINYARYLPDFDIELVEPDAGTYDLDAAHAAGLPGAMVNHCHGLLWTGEIPYNESGYQINRDLIESFRLAREITVPSEWVARPFRRDMRRVPHVIPHGVNWDEWQNEFNNDRGYILWGKNRTSDGLDPAAINEIAAAFPDRQFLTTFATPYAPDNVQVIGHAIPHEEMKELIQCASVLLAPDRETFGIQHLEAMACGVPVLSVDSGAVPTFATHGIAGYCFQPGNLQDAIDGLAYCLQYRDQLGANGREISREFTWEKTCASIAGVYRLALFSEDEPTVSVIIPCYNYGHHLSRAIESVSKQSCKTLERIIVVDDGSTDNTRQIAEEWAVRDGRVCYIYQENSGVAIARNTGLKVSQSIYACFLDADDYLEPGFLEYLVDEIDGLDEYGVAYTGVRVPLNDGTVIVPWDWPYALLDGEIQSDRVWPSVFSYEGQMQRDNQIPTCCLIRREALLQVGGYRARYCPMGAGTEDAELFLRLGAAGWRMHYAPPKAYSLFVHTVSDGIHSGRYGDDQREIFVDWTTWHPWVNDHVHPFASIAIPANGISHPVYSYENTLVSVIIPVGPGHEDNVINALDSLEAQTFRGWEAIVVWDCERPPDRFLVDAYPYVNWQVVSPGGLGAGRARNIGVSAARSPLIAFLDADDYYHAGFLDICVRSFLDDNAVIYTDYVSILPGDRSHQPGMDIVRERPDGTVLVSARFDDFDEQKAMIRPSGERPYVWSGITILLPRVWHESIVGFDGAMNTWEDCDYLLRLAWAGYPFRRIPEELWIYSFVSGKRRLSSEGNEDELMKHLQAKYDNIVLGEPAREDINV